MSYFFNNHRSKKLTFILIASTGLFSSQIHGSNLWERIGPYGGNIADMEVIDSTPDYVYICSFENAHFSESSDCGTTWSLPARMVPDNSLMSNATILVVDPLKNKNRYLSYYYKFYASNDYGKTWKGQSLQDINANVFDFVKSNADSALFFSASQTWNQATQKLNFCFVRSRNEGITWEYKNLISNRNNSSAQCIALNPNAFRKLFHLFTPRHHFSIRPY